MILTELHNGDSFRISQIKVPGATGKRLSDMGFTRNTEGLVVRSALFGDPIQVTIMGYNVSIRRTEAASIEVELLKKA